MGGAGDDQATAIATLDTRGNPTYAGGFYTYVAGTFSQTAQFESTNLTSLGGTDIFLAKYDSQGNLVLLRQYGGTNNDSVVGLAVDAKEGIVLAGTFFNSITLDNVVLGAPNSNAFFVASLRSDGSVPWARYGVGQGAGSSNVRLKAMSVSSSGNIFCCGSFKSVLNCAGTTVSSSGGWDAFVAKWDSAGTLQWLRRAGSSLDDEANGLATDRSGNAMVTGSFQNTSFNYGQYTVTNSNTSNEVFVARLDASGFPTWLKSAGTAQTQSTGAKGNDVGLAVAAGSDDSLFVLGQFSEYALFGYQPLSGTVGATNLFLARYNSTGEVMWARSAGAVSPITGNALAVDKGDNVYLTGTYLTNTSFGGVYLNGAGSNDCFVASYDGAGKFLWAKNAGGAKSDAGLAITTDLIGGVYIAGSFQTNLIFGSGEQSLTSAGGSDGFFARLDDFPSNSAPLFTSQTIPHTTLSNSNHTFSVGVQTPAPVKFQWLFEGAPIFSATNSTFRRGPISYTNVGNYSVVVSNAFGVVTSSPALLTLEIRPTVNWLDQQGGVSGDETIDTTADAAGNFYLTGYIGTNATIGTTVLTSTAASNVFVARFGSDGGVLWARKSSGTGRGWGQSIAVDAQSNVVVAGSFLATTTISFGSSTLTNNSQATADIFLAKYSPVGDVLWGKKAGGIYTDKANAVVVDSAGNIYLTGSFMGVASFATVQSTINLTNSSTLTNDIFIAKYDSSGNVLWAKKIGSSGPDEGVGLALDKSGAVYLTGSLGGTATFDSLTVVATNGNFLNLVPFIAKYDANGGVIWARAGAGIGYGQKVALDPFGYIYVTSYKRDYGTGTLLTKYDGNGNVLWFREYSGLSCCTGDYLSANGLAVDERGNPVLTGAISGYGTLGSLSIVREGYTAKFSDDGTLLWAMKSGQSGAGVATTGPGIIYGAGRFTYSQTAFFDTQTLSSRGGTDGYVMRLAINSPVLNFTPTNYQVIVGSSLTLQASVSGNGPFTYQWQRNGTNINGATTSALTINNFQSFNNGTDRIVVRNTLGTTVTGVVATLQAVPILGFGASTNSLTIGWPTGFVLQFSTNAAGPYEDIITNNPVTISFDQEQAGFYRLRSSP
jgi:hypothetical protein